MNRYTLQDTFQHADYKTIGNICRTDKSFRDNICNDNGFWKERANRDFNIDEAQYNSTIANLNPATKAKFLYYLQELKDRDITDMKRIFVDMIKDNRIDADSIILAYDLYVEPIFIKYLHNKKGISGLGIKGFSRFFNRSSAR
jgi:hypothetical protein